MFTKSNVTPQGWLAFELNVLWRLKFKSAALPVTNGKTNLGAYLKRRGVRVLANDLNQSAQTKAIAEIQNNGETLSPEDVATVLEDAYVPRYRLQNAALRNWFNETDAWWFDNVRQNIEKIASPIGKAIALKIGMSVGDYVLSFTEETRELRQPLSNVYKKLVSIEPSPVNNGQNNLCANKSINEFIAENHPDLMFLRLPRAHNLSLRNALGWKAWREEWLRGSKGGGNFWADLETAQKDRLGTHVETKFQYLHLVEEVLKTASHIPLWSVAHVEDGFISTQDIVETISRARRVETIFTKDFSELTGTKAVIITA
jgi:hypothetical protein